MTDSLGALLCGAGAALRAAGIADHRREARRLLAHAAGLTDAGLLAARHTPADAAVATRFAALVARRAAREPLAHLTGSVGFWSLELAISPATLIPRADSETLVEAVLAARPDRGAALRVLDLGTGTGCLLLAVLAEYPAATGLGVDRVAAAAALAAGNAARNGLAGRAAFIAGDWAAALAGRFDLILSNPPYIESGVIPRLMAEVARFEPASALDGGADGLDAYRRLVAALPGLLAPGGLAVLELGQGQAAEVTALARASGLEAVGLRADLAGIDRALLLQTA
jgi:release factor glutamine methyltransferase